MNSKKVLKLKFLNYQGLGIPIESGEIFAAPTSNKAQLTALSMLDKIFIDSSPYAPIRDAFIFAREESTVGSLMAFTNAESILSITGFGVSAGIANPSH